jgi:hypothetical protein
VAAVASSLRPWPVSRSNSGPAPALGTGQEACRHPPLAPMSVQWLQSVTNSLNLLAARVRLVLSFAGKNLHHGVRYL